VPANTPFGSIDFRAYNIDFINDYKNYAAGPALAVSISYANAGFYFCGLYSYQDTVRNVSAYKLVVHPTDRDDRCISGSSATRISIRMK
jgi:hypothetical protein